MLSGPTAVIPTFVRHTPTNFGIGGLPFAISFQSRCNSRNCVNLLQDILYWIESASVYPSVEDWPVPSDQLDPRSDADCGQRPAFTQSPFTRTGRGGCHIMMERHMQSRETVSNNTAARSAKLSAIAGQPARFTSAKQDKGQISIDLQRTAAEPHVRLPGPMPAVLSIRELC